MEIMEYTDTIAAIATAMGNSGIGIVRISGENAVEIAEKVFRAPGKKKLQEIDEAEDATAKDDDLFTTLEVCYEFYLRGFTFAPIDLYRSHATRFVIEDGKLLPPFVSVSGLGETAAWDIMDGREGKEFLSIEEFSLACPKVSKTHIENLKAAGAFGDLPETSQITLF